MYRAQAALQDTSRVCGAYLNSSHVMTRLSFALVPPSFAPRYGCHAWPSFFGPVGLCYDGNGGFRCGRAQTE